MRDVIDYVFCALCIVSPASAVSWNRQATTGKACNEWSEKHLLNWDWSAFKCSDTNVVFQTAIFLVLFVRNNKMSSGI